MLAERVTNNGASWLSNPVTVKGRTMSTGDSTASTAGRSVECHVCGKMFSTKASCNRHYRVVHERQARYSCRQPGCGYRTDSHFNLMRHERKHGCQFQGSKLAPDYVPRTASRRSGAGSAQANKTPTAGAADATREGRHRTTFNAGDDNSMNTPPPVPATVGHVSGAGAGGQVMPGLVPMPGGGYMSALPYPLPYAGTAGMQHQGLMQAPPPTPGLPFGMVHPGAAPQPRQPMVMVMAPMSAAPIPQQQRQQQRQQLGPAVMTMLPPNGPSLSYGIPASAGSMAPVQASPYVSMQYAQYAYASAAQYHQQRQLSAASHEGHQQQPRRLSETQHPSQRQEPSGPSAWVSSSSPAQYHVNKGTLEKTARSSATSTTVQKSATVTSRAAAEHGASSMGWTQAQAAYSTGIALAAQPRYMSSAHTPSSPAVSVPTIWRPVASTSSSTDTVSGHETTTDGTFPVTQTAT